MNVFVIYLHFPSVFVYCNLVTPTFISAPNILDTVSVQCLYVIILQYFLVFIMNNVTHSFRVYTEIKYLNSILLSQLVHLYQFDVKYYSRLDQDATTSF